MAIQPRRLGRVPFFVSIVLAALAGAAVILVLIPPPLPARSSANGSTSPGEVARPFQPVSLDQPVPPFTLLDQNGKDVTLEDLRGHVWIAGFIYTRCHGICPTVSAAMAQLRDELPEDVRLVSFSVDPRHDTPEVLKQYAASFHADPKRWLFLTGDAEHIRRVSREGFLLAVEENTDPRTRNEDLVIHSNRLILVDRDGMARGTYSSADPASLDQLQRAARKILGDRS